MDWLKEAGVVNVCYCLSHAELPLKGNYDAESYKIYYHDTGLLVASLDDEAQDDLRINRNFGTYKGAIYENVVGEMLRKSGYGQLYYYKHDSPALEMDFFVRTANALLPIEVKAQNRQAKSLKILIEDERYPDIRSGIKLSSGNIGHENRIRTFPYFCTFLLRRFLRAMTE